MHYTKITVAHVFLSLGAIGKPINSQIRYHPLNKTLEVARSSGVNSRFYNIPQMKHLTTPQCRYLGLFDAAKFPPPIPSISFLIGLCINETEVTDCGMSAC